MKFTNSGNSGTDYSELVIIESVDVMVRKAILFRGTDANRSVILGREQVYALRNELTKWLDGQPSVCDLAMLGTTSGDI